jgi:hypothetical protein
MIDDFAILLSTLLCVYVTWRAYKLNNSGVEESIVVPSAETTKTVSPSVNSFQPPWEVVPPPPDRTERWDDALL